MHDSQKFPMAINCTRFLQHSFQLELSELKVSSLVTSFSPKKTHSFIFIMKFSLIAFMALGAAVMAAPVEVSVLLLPCYRVFANEKKRKSRMSTLKLTPSASHTSVVSLTSML